MTLVAFTGLGSSSPVAGVDLRASPLRWVLLLTSIGVFLTTPGAHSRHTSPATNKKLPSPNSTGMIFRIVSLPEPRRRSVAQRTHVSLVGTGGRATYSATTSRVPCSRPVVAGRPSDGARQRLRDRPACHSRPVPRRTPSAAVTAPVPPETASAGSPTTLPALDSMRAVAAVAVVATHASFWGGAYAQAQVRHGAGAPRHRRRDLLRALRLPAVPSLAGRHARGLPAPSTGRYLWKRALRILPVYVLAVVAALLLLPGNNGASPGLWVKTLTLTNIYFDDRLPDGLTQMWSLATEVAFYVAAPGDHVARAVPAPGRPSVSQHRVGAVTVVLVVLNALWVLELADAARPGQLPGSSCGSRRTSPGSRSGSCSRRARASSSRTAPAAAARRTRGQGGAVCSTADGPRPPASAGRPPWPCSPSPRPRWRDRPRSPRPTLGEA